MSRTTSPAHSVSDPNVPEQLSSLLPQGNPDFELDDKENKWVEIEDPNGYPSLDFKPMVLQTPFLISVFAIFLACFTSLLILLYRSKKHGSIHLSSKPSYFALHYAPTVIGTITTILWRTIISNFNRLTPYMSMAGSARNQTWRKTMGAAYFPWFCIDCGAGHWKLMAASIQTDIMLWIIPLKSALFIGTADSIEGGWEIRFSPNVAIALIVIYALMACSTLALLIDLWGRRTGLKWDPVSIADKLVLLRGSDILNDFDGLDTMNSETINRLGGYFHDGPIFSWLKHTIRRRLPANRETSLEGRTYRLGYWSKGGEIWHGIRKGSDYSGGKIKGVDNTKRPVLSARSEMFSKGTVIVLTVLACTIASGLIFGLSKGVKPERFSPSSLIPHVSKRSVTNGSLAYPVPNLSQYAGVFIFRGLLTSFSGLFVWFWWSVDLFYRATQPFAGMDEGNPQPASENILLDYLCSPPIIVSINATMNGHLRVAYFSFLSLASNLFPVLVGGLFVIDSSTGGIILLMSVQSYYAICAFIFVYCISIPITFPTRKRMLPRNILSLGDLASFCYDSKLLTGDEYDSAFALNLPTDTRRHMECRLFLMETKYEFFTYRTDTGWRIRFDVARDRV